MTTGYPDRPQRVLAMYSTPGAAQTERLLHHPGGLELALAPGPGHYLHPEHPDLAAGVLERWLARVAR